MDRHAPPGREGIRPYRYTIRRFGADSIGAGTVSLAKGRARIETSLTEPAMLVVEVTPPVGVSDFGNASTGGRGRVRLGAAVEPRRLTAAEPKPADFDAFWAEKLRQLAQVRYNPVVTPGESDRIAIEWFGVRLNNVGGSHIYGQLAKPAGEGKFPAVLVSQWASPPYPLQKTWVTSLAALGYLAFNIEPHDVPADMPQAFYDALPAIIKQYNTIGNAQPRRELLPSHVPRRLSRRRVPRQPARLGWQDDRRDGHEHGRPAELRRGRPQSARDRSDRERSLRSGRHGGAPQAVGELPELERVQPPRPPLTIVNVAAARKVTLTEVSSTLEGVLDARGATGLDDSYRNGFERVRVAFSIKGDARARSSRRSSSGPRRAPSSTTSSPTRSRVDVTAEVG